MFASSQNNIIHGHNIFLEREILPKSQYCFMHAREIFACGRGKKNENLVKRAGRA